MSEIRFYGEHDSYFELANFYPSPIMLDGVVWPTVEHYFQAQKSRDPVWKEKVRTCESPEESKRLGWETLDYDDDWWLANREAVMGKALRAKFEQHPELLEILLSTGDAILIEDAPNDMFWGIGDGSGLNKMGVLLMKLREEKRSGVTLHNTR